MPLITAKPRGAGETPPASATSAITDLSSDDPDLRRRAALALAEHPEAVPALAARLTEETMPPVRQAIAGSLVSIGDADAANALANLLTNADAALRCIALDSLKQLGSRAFAAVDVLLGDFDAHVRLQAIEAVRAWPGPDACVRLHSLFEHEAHVNVCAAAVDVATEVGSAEILPDLAHLASRFPNNPFLSFAIEVAISRITAAGEHGG
jgi:HEAT repeat protein